MPNWCSNHIQIRGSNSAEIKRLADAFDKDEFCNAVIPTPEDLNITAGFLGDGDKQKELERKEQENLAKYGVKNWYDFQTSRWGTKWDISTNGCPADRDEDGLGFSGSFDTAWSPPMGVIEALVEEGYEVTLRYYEPGMAYVGKFEDGYDEYYELGGETSKTVRSAIGDDLDDFFGISESMAEYEAENEEELTAWIKDGKEANDKLGLVSE